MALHWKIELLRLDLKYTWAISRNATNHKVNAIVSVTDGECTGRGEAAPNVRYGEDPDSFLKVFSELEMENFQESSFQELADFLRMKMVPNALRFAIESAFVHYQSKKENQNVHDLLGLSSPGRKHTAYTIPIMEPEKLPAYFLQYNPQRFQYIKLKVNDQNMISFVTEVRKLCSNTFIVDANEAYLDPDKYLRDIEECNETNIAFVEQPFPAAFKEEYHYLKARTELPIFGDESITDDADFFELQQCFHGINVKLMKAGGYLNAIRLLKEAKRFGLRTMVGCMVETGLGISSGMHIASLADYLDLDSFLILNRDPFQYVKEDDGVLFLKE